jgi:hypothetical protein
MASAETKSRGGMHARTPASDGVAVMGQGRGLIVAASYSSSSWSRTAARPYWLPPGGIGNGLDAETWAPLIDADAGELILLLDTLRDADIAAYAARLDRSGRRRPRSAFRIWVDTWTHARAEDVIREALLRHRRADR